MKRLTSFIFNLFNSVWFGIALMLLIGIYIGVGSGISSVRKNVFEATELEFFHAWPLKVLALLLVVNLMVVTLVRIPFTPPRYGVWAVHLGIILLVMGMSIHYHFKLEGMARINVGQTVQKYFDASERSLYIKYDKGTMEPPRVRAQPMPSLPRYNQHLIEDGGLSAWRLNRSDLASAVELPTGQSQTELVQFKVTGFWPWSAVRRMIEPDPTSKTPGVRLSFALPDHEDHPGHDEHEQHSVHWLIANDQDHAYKSFSSTEFEHRHVTPEYLELFKQAASQIFQFQIKLKDQTKALDVQPGKTYSLDDSGYSFTVENYLPDWPMFDSTERVRAMVLNVKSPTKEFRRMVLEGKPVQTDFLPDPEGKAPMGIRQKNGPVDTDLTIQFTLNDPGRLLPKSGTTKNTIITTDAGAMVNLACSPTAPATITEFKNGTGDLEVIDKVEAPFLKAMGQAPPEQKTKVHVDRVAGVRKSEELIPLPESARTSERDNANLGNVIRVETTLGNWKKSTLVTFIDNPDDAMWDASRIELPDNKGSLQLALSKTAHRLPARLTLQKFELVPYPGGDENRGSIMRDFKSTLEVQDTKTGVREIGVARMNEPIYFDSGRWIFFQSGYDPDKQQFTIIGVGNRPGVVLMTVGCVLMTLGLLYAFYVKPVIIRKMKQNALAKAQATRKVNPEPVSIGN